MSYPALRFARAFAFVVMALTLFCASQARAQTVDWVLNLSDAGSDPTPAGGTINYAITVTNNGFGNAPATTVNLTVPAGTTFTGGTGTITGCTPTPSVGPATITCNIPALASSASATLSASVLTTVAQNVSFRARVPETGDDVPGNSDITELTTVGAGADLSLALVSPATAASGSIIPFTFTATNNGPNAATNKIVSFPVPSGISNVVPPAGCTLSGSTYSCTIPGPIPVNGTASLVFQGQISAGFGSTITALGDIAGGTPSDPISGNNLANFNTTVTAGSDVTIAKSRAPLGNLLVGDSVAFTLAASYTGDSPNGLVITDTIPANYSVGAIVAPGWLCTVTGQLVRCTRTSGTGPGSNVSLGSITVNATVISAGSATNTANISSSGPVDPNPSNNTDDDGGAIIDLPVVDLEARKSGPNPALVVIGNPYTFDIGTANVGNASFYGTAVLRDDLPAGLRFDGFTGAGWSCLPAAPVTGPAAITCQRVYTQASPLAAGAATPLVTIETTVLSAGPILNSLTVSSPDANIADLNAPNDTITYGVTGSTGANSSDISVVKTAAIASLAVGDIQTFTLQVNNAGPQPSQNVTLTDDLIDLINSAEGATGSGFMSASIAPGSATGLTCASSATGGNSRRLSCTIADLPVCSGASCPTITVQIRPGGEAGARNNTARAISSVTADPNLVNNSGAAPYAVTARADVTITKAASPASAFAGQNITYVLTAQNLANGLSSAAGVTVTDTLPANMTFVSASPSSGSCSTQPAANSITGAGNNSVVCNLGTIPNGSQQTITIIARPNFATRGNTLTNNASIATSTVETDSTNNAASALTPIAAPVVELIINKDDTVDPLSVADNTVYTVTVTNIGPSAAENVNITDTMPPAGVSYQSFTVSAGGVCGTVPAIGSFGGSLICNFPVVPAGQTRTLTITGLGVSKGIHRNNASVTSDETIAGFEADTSNNTGFEDTTVRTRADVEVVSKVATPGTVNLLDPFTYVIRIRNNTGVGFAEADNVVVSDNLPANMQLVGAPTAAVISGTASLSTCTGASGATTFSCDLGTMSNPAVVDITLPVRIIAITSSPQTFNNTASVVTSSFDPIPANNSNSGPVDVLGSSIAGRVFRDFANDAGFNGSDTGIGSVVMTLTGTASDGITTINRTVNTAPDGTYTFANLPEGTYSISQGTISETSLSNGTTTAGTSSGTAAPTAITAIALADNTAATGYLFPKIPQARVAIAKAVQTGPVINPDGTFNVTFRLNVRNLSLEALTNVAVNDTLSGASPRFGTYVSIGAPATGPLAAGSYTMLAAPSGTCGGLNAGFNGSANTSVASGFNIAATTTCTIDVQLRVQPTSPLPPLLAGGARYFNQASVTGEGALSGQTSATNPQLTDLSDNGTNPDPNGNGLGNETGENDPTPVTINQAPAIRLVKSITSVTDTTGDTLIGAGDTVAYSFAVTNTGSLALAGVTVTDPLVTVVGTPVNLAIGATNTTAFTASYVLTQADIDRGYVDNTATTVGNAVTSSGTPILDGAGNPVTTTDVSDTGTAPDAAATPVAAPATTESPSGSGATDADPTNDPTVAVLAPQPRIVLTKSLTGVTDTVADGQTGAGDTVAYTFAVTNTGTVALGNVTVTDPLVVETGGPISLAIGATNTSAFTATYVLTQADIDRGYVNNTATATGTAVTTTGTPILDGSGNPVTTTDTSDTGTAADRSTVASPATTETPDGAGATDANPGNDPTPLVIVPTTGIRLVKSYSGSTDTNGNGYVDAGDVLNFTFAVTNTGNLTLANVAVSDPIAVLVGGPIPSLAPGATDTATFTATYVLTDADIDRTYFENTATTTGAVTTTDGAPILDGSGNPLTVSDVSDTGTDPDANTITDPAATETPNAEDVTDGNPTNDPTVVQLGRPQIALDIQVAGITDINGNGITDAGDEIIYTFILTNTGNIPLFDANIDPSTISLPLVGLVCQPITMAVGETATLVCTGNRHVITAEDVAAGTVTLGGDARGTSEAGQVVTAADAVVSIPLGLGGLGITKTVDRSRVSVGDIVTYTITVTNSSATLTTVTNIVDRLPAGFTYETGTARVAGAAVEPQANGRTLTWTNVSLAPRGSVIVTLNVRIGSGVEAGDHDNVARAVSPLTGRAVTPDAIATVRIAVDPVFSCSTVIGRVFDDRNQDGYFNGEPREEKLDLTDYTEKMPTSMMQPAQSKDGREKGLPGVRLITPNGLAITTDGYGRFSVPCAALPASGIGSNFMLKLDTRTLPSGYRLTTENPRVVRVTQGMLTKMNFGAAISRVVRVDISAKAFGQGDAARRPVQQLVDGLEKMVADIASTPSTLRFTYQLAEGESERLARQRLREVEKIIRKLWPDQGRYQLNVETHVQRRAASKVTK
jgi:uncharacterized repeat protein (TIGR01451 family)